MLGGVSAAASFSPRQPPHVPHHTVVRAIGRGSYGEIWLARSLTSAWRAVKIVERGRFDDSRSFDREFDGMATFEPVSREHAGFVDILHVGRSDDDAFFYYVMELADDVVPRESFDPGTYQPKTLKSELQRVSRLPADEVVALGMSLTLALAALHRHGLVHRDIKPANIIFVGGHPKIADIGLVSPLGQESFVGTEGYVPPEGPGSAQADLFSLGKVLYEIAMGKDRLDFPEVADDLEDIPDRDMLLQLNQVLWRACAHSPLDRYATADEMHEDLRRVQEGRPLGGGGRRRRRWLPIAALLLATASGLAWWKLGDVPPRGVGKVRIETDPPGVPLKVVLESKNGHGQLKGVSEDIELPPGRHKARLMGSTLFDPVVFEFEVEPNQPVRSETVTLTRSHGTAKIESTPADLEFEVRDGEKVLRSGKTPQDLILPTGDYSVLFRHPKGVKTETLAVGRSEVNTARATFITRKIHVTSNPPGAEIFCDGEFQLKADCELELLEGEHEIIARYLPWPDTPPRKIKIGDGEPEPVVFSFENGGVKIMSRPSGAEVFLGDKLMGRTGPTPYLEEGLTPGEVTYTLKLSGYQPQQKKIRILPGKTVFEPVIFEAKPGPRKGDPWENSLGMKFVPVGNVLVGVWPVRVRDYVAYSAETGRPRLTVDFPQDENHPVVRVKWDDAVAFCEWLTEHEIAAGKLEKDQEYRLPTDVEWSMAAGISDEGGATPEQRDGVNRDFPWEKSNVPKWPPPANVGNYGDAAFRQATGNSPRTGSIAGYHDGFAHTSPVGAFPPNALGLFDLSGNVWQWVADSYNADTQKNWGVLRGGCWATCKPEELRLGYRNVVPREESDVIFGFRCVLVPEK
jgi:eukaryotic-like serine/threonine-protein kinase